MSKEHLKAISWITTYTVLAGVFISAGELHLVIIGILYILMGIYYENKFLTTWDTRKEVEKTKQILNKYIEEAKKIKDEISDMKNKIFDFASSNPIMSIESRIESLDAKIDRLERSVEELRAYNENMVREISRGL